MVDLAREAFSTNNFDLAADIYERTIRENGPTSELCLGLADSLARGGQFAKAFQSYTNAYRYGHITSEKLKHLVIGLIDVVKQETTSSGNLEHTKKGCMFTCGICRGLFDDPVTLPCGHTYCRKCIEKDISKPCEVCSIVHYRLKARHLCSNVVLTNLVEKWFPKERKAIQLKKKGNDLFSARNYKCAIEMYSQAIEIARTDHLLLSNRSHAYASLDRFEEALCDAEQVVQLRADWPKGYFRKGCALYGLGRYEEAVVSFLQCLALDQTVSAAKEYLSKALDRILSSLPPDDPKSHAMQQQVSPSLLQQLIDNNFSQPILMPNIASTLSHLAHNVKDTIHTASNFSWEEPTPQLFLTSSDETSRGDGSERGGQQIEAESDFQESVSPPFCSADNKLLPEGRNTDKLQDEKTVSESRFSYSTSPNSRKRFRNLGITQCPVSPTHSSPLKVLKATTVDSGVTVTSPLTTTAAKMQSDAKMEVAATMPNPAESEEMKPEQSNIEDMECGLCYRLFFEPVTTPCGHTFCRKCLERCLDHTVSCPMCMGNLAEYLAERKQAVTEALQSIMETYFKEAYAERCRINEEEMIELTRMGSGQQSDIPVFVCILTFPTIPCPLHVFEPRYRLMVRQCMESGTRQFGMCMNFSDNDDDFSDYGCMLEIRDVQYFPDGRSVVDTIGGHRFKVLSRGKRDGYNTAKVEFISDKPVDASELEAVESLQTEIHAMVKKWLSKLPAVHHTRIIQHFGELPDIDPYPYPLPNGPRWAWWAVAVLPLNPRVQITLLAMSSFQERLIALKKVLAYMNRKGAW